MTSSVIKRSIILSGRKTSVSLETEFWDSLREIAGRKKMTLSGLVTEIDVSRKSSNLSSAIRLFVLHYHRSRYEQQISETI